MLKTYQNSAMEFSHLRVIFSAFDSFDFLDFPLLSFILLEREYWLSKLIEAKILIGLSKF